MKESDQAAIVSVLHYLAIKRKKLSCRFFQSKAIKDETVLIDRLQYQLAEVYSRMKNERNQKLKLIS